ncbi:MAG TPA: hypothetical protein VFA93_00490 [Patescibacteria group bacterium]|nr:hypothetical protein [Patescibacteria group bacterium]
MNRKLLIGILAAVVVLAVGGYFIFGRSKTQTTAPGLQEQSIPTISAKEIGLTLTPSSDKHKITIEVDNTKDIASIDYELSYLSKGDIPRGALGHVDVKTPGQPVKTDAYLGTCSDVCHPDTEVHNIKVIVKVNKTDGKVYQAQASVELQ